MAVRTHPNDYFAWFNDDQRLAILTLDTTSTTSGERTTEKYDTFQDSGNLSGTITNMLTNGSVVTVTSASHDLATDDRITISGSAFYDGDYSITKIDSNTFTFSSGEVAAAADTISDLDVASGTATVTTGSTAHGLSVGDTVYIDASTDSYDEEVTVVTVPSSTTFTYTTSNGDTTNLTGTVGDTGTFTSLFIDDGIRITYKSKYEPVSAITEDLDDDIGLDTGLQPSLVCYMKARLYEDQGNFEQANYFRQMYEGLMMKQRSRKSGVRSLAVPNL